MSVLDSKISFFKNTKSTSVVRDPEKETIRYWLNAIRDGTYKKDIDKIRAGDEDLKLKLPTIAMHGEFKDFREGKDFLEASGIIILDIDDIDPDDDLEEIKKDISESSEHIVAVFISPSGDGLKVLYYVNPLLVTQDTYRKIGKEIVVNFSEYGKVDYLSLTDTLIVSYDENIYINEDAEPAYVYVKEHIPKDKVELEPLDKNKVLWEDVEDFFDTVLANDIAGKTNNNFHFIQVSIFDLAKFGFYHPKEDLSFVIHYAEEHFKRSKDNEKRFNEVVAIAKEIQQSRWAYRTIRDDFFDDEEDGEDGELDYSEYVSKPKKESSHKVEDGVEEYTISDDDSGFIDYDNDSFWKRVLSTAKEGNRVGAEISLKGFSNNFRFKGTGILTITGIPSHGKTEFSDECILDLARLHNHETIIVGFEQTPEEHVIKLSKKLIGLNVTCESFLNKDGEIRFKKAYDFITSKIKHVDTTIVGGNINTILEKCARKIKDSREAGGNPRYVVIDPFNMLSIKGRFSGHEKIEEILRRITQFSHQMNVLVILIAHPFKMKKDEKTGRYEVPDFYSVKGSSAFFEMSYHGIVVYRTGYSESDLVLVKILKVKQNNLGNSNEEVFFTYERNSGRYIPVDSEGNEESGDHREKNWLERALEKQKVNKIN